MTPATKRICLIHALRESQEPSWRAFAAGWPEAEIHNLLDDSLAPDLAATGMNQAIIDRFLALGRYAAGSGPHGRGADAILFTCSAFGPAIEAVQRELSIPVLKPNEAAFEAALAAGPRIGILVTFAPSLPALTEELVAMARARGAPLTPHGAVAEGALAALKAGRAQEHDAIVAATAARLPSLDALVLGQFSLARAASAIAPVAGRRLLTTPDSAVAKLKTLLAAR